jgi:hypothetical protein
MFERVRARKTEKGVAVFMRAYGTYHFLQEIIEFVNKFYLPPWRCLCVPTVDAPASKKNVQKSSHSGSANLG